MIEIVSKKQNKPLNILGQREVKFPPDHFYYTDFDFFVGDPNGWAKSVEISLWIQINLTGRYCVYKKPVCKKYYSQENKRCGVLTIGFESEAELTMFLLSCPFLR